MKRFFGFVKMFFRNLFLKKTVNIPLNREMMLVAMATCFGPEEIGNGPISSYKNNRIWNWLDRKRLTKKVRDKK